MSDIVGGGISRGEGDDQVVLMFSGRLKPDEWAAFVEAIVQTAKNHNVKAEPWGKQVLIKVSTVQQKKPPPK